jgi:hypothetical protein
MIEERKYDFYDRADRRLAVGFGGARIAVERKILSNTRKSSRPRHKGNTHQKPGIPQQWNAHRSGTLCAIQPKNLYQMPCAEKDIGKRARASFGPKAQVFCRFHSAIRVDKR